MSEEKFNYAFIEQAARLIYLGLEEKRNLIGDTEFKELSRLYKNDSKFRHMVIAIANGLYLDILDVDNSGIFLRAHQDSIFAKTRSHIRKLTEGGLDKYTGVILIGLAAYYYPKGTAFDEEHMHSTSPISTNELDLFIREKCEKIKQTQKPKDHPAGSETLELLMTSFLNLPGAAEVDSRARNTSTAIIKKTLGYLVDEGLLIEKDNKYWPTSRFRYQMQSMAQNEQIKTYVETIGGE